MEKKKVITLLFRRPQPEGKYVEDKIKLLVSVDKIYEKTNRFYMINGTPLSWRFSFPTPRISLDEAENDLFLDLLYRVVVDNWNYEILASGRTNHRTWVECRALV